MVLSLLNPIRLLAEAGLATITAPTAGMRRYAPTPSQAVLRLVATACAADDDPDSCRDLFSQLDDAQRRTSAFPHAGEEAGYVERLLDTLPLSGEPAMELSDCLGEYGRFLERDARLDEALQALALSARARGASLTLPELAVYVLDGGRLHRLLARWDQAAACYATAAEVGGALQDDTVLLRSRLGWGAVYRGQGELAAARAAIEVAMREADRAGLCDLHALGYWSLGVILRLEGAFGEGLQVVQHASQILCDPDERRHAMRDVGLAFAAVGAYDDARAAFEAILASSDDALLRTSAVIGLMDVESAAGDRLAFGRHRDAVESAKSRMPPGMAVAYRYKLGEGLARFRQHGRACAVLNEALALARAHRLHGWCNEIESRLDEPVAKAG